MFLPISFLIIAVVLTAGIVANKYSVAFAGFLGHSEKFARIAPYAAWAMLLLGAFFFPLNRVY